MKTTDERQQRIQYAYESWRWLEGGLVELSDIFGVEPEEILDYFKKRHPIPAKWVEVKLFLAYNLALCMRRVDRLVATLRRATRGH